MKKLMLFLRLICSFYSYGQRHISYIKITEIISFHDKMLYVTGTDISNKCYTIRFVPTKKPIYVGTMLKVETLHRSLKDGYFASKVKVL